MSDTEAFSPDRDEIDAVLRQFDRVAADYLSTVDDRPVLEVDAGDRAVAFRRPLPAEGIGAEAALAELYDAGHGATTATSGPRFFHWVTGGVTPAAMGADWMTGLLDQQAYAWPGSPLGVELELVSLGWLKELFGLPASMSGIMVTGASMANGPRRSSVPIRREVAGRCEIDQ